MKPADKLISGFFCACAFLIASGLCQASTSPIHTRDQNPFVLIYGLPSPSPARLTTQPEPQFSHILTASNTVFTQSSANEALYIDIETWQYQLLLDYRLNQQWQLRMQLPVIAHTPGLLDASIDGYHQAFNLYEDIRPFVERDRLDIRYLGSSGDTYAFNRREQDLGDIALQLAWQQSRSPELAISHWLSLKLPTGDPQQLSGSGHTDLSAWSAFSLALQPQLELYGQAGFLYMSDSDLLAEIHKHWALFSTLGLGLEISPLEFKAQLDMHSAMYDSALQFLGKAYQLSLGVDYVLDKTSRLSFAFTEDLDNGTAPDISFSLGWYYHY